MRTLKEFGAAFGLLLFLVAVSFVPDSCFGGSGTIHAVFLGTVAAGVGASNTFNLTYVPQFVGLKLAAASGVQSITLTVIGEDGVIVNLSDIDVIDTIGQYNRFEDGSALFRMIPCADGRINRPSVALTVTNASGVNTIDVYAIWMQPGKAFFQNTQTKLYANTPTDFDNFTALAIPALVTADEVNITYRNGIVARTNLSEIQGVATLYQNGVNSLLGIIDNQHQTISNVQVIPAADKQSGVICVKAPK